MSADPSRARTARLRTWLAGSVRSWLGAGSAFAPDGWWPPDTGCSAMPGDPWWPEPRTGAVCRSQPDPAERLAAEAWRWLQSQGGR
ncbi:MAG TPA: hypothetical protein VE990_05930 [Acidimicrobiales bacterium]|nr:hypothetical protein [Acidimicrobiales bacterium]